MTAARLALAAALLVGCSEISAPDPQNPETGAAMSEGTALPDDAFARPWVFIDQLKFDHPFDALVSTPLGFVAISHAPTLDGRGMPPTNNITAVSRDGVTWEEGTLGPKVHGRALAHGNGVTVAVGMRRSENGLVGAILVSSDGKRWDDVATPPQNLMDVSFVQGRFWAFGSFGAFWTSSDGRTWQDHSRSEYFQLHDVAYGNGRYVIVGNGSWLSSADGQTWSQHRSICGDVARCPGVVPPGGSPPGSLVLFSVLFGKGLFVTQGSDGGWASSDGLSWSEAPGAVSDGVFSGGRFVSIARQPAAVVVSDDGRSSSSRTSFIVSDQPPGCTGRVCLVMDGGILVVPNAGDAPALARLPEISFSRATNRQTQAVQVGQRIWVNLQTIGPGSYGDPVVSSDAVRFLDVRGPIGPPNPGGPQQYYRFLTSAPGHAEIRIPHTGTNEAFELTLDVTAR